MLVMLAIINSANELNKEDEKGGSKKKLYPIVWVDMYTFSSDNICDIREKNECKK